MKKFIFAACLLLGTLASYAQQLTKKQEAAQRTIYFFLDKKGHGPLIDEKDNSVNIRDNAGTLYWVSFDDAEGRNLTFHRNSLKFDKKSKLRFNADLAISAANEVNSKHGQAKVIVKDSLVSFVLPGIYPKPEYFTECFEDIFREVKNIYSEFIRIYERELAIDEERQRQAEENAFKSLPPSELIGQVKDYKVRELDGKKNVVRVYGDVLQGNARNYVQVAFVMSPRKVAAKTYRFELRIESEERGDNTKPLYTAKCVKEIEIAKSKKEATYEFDPIAPLQTEEWPIGVYNFKIIEAGSVIFEGHFNIL